ncbi:MAG: OmpA/MotB domain-containing protein [Bacteroidetes bacterium]|nr:MAG: OmpA/MotB domain-containing protein [Bacteroidota bacterium]
MMKRIQILTLLVLCSCLSLFGQSRREWLDFGDQAFEKKNYMLAVTCYKHVIDLVPGSDRDAMLPYEYKPWIPPAKKNKKDSTATPAPVDTTKKIDVDPRTQYVTHKMADCYRLLNDYDNAEAYYAKALTMPSDQFPDARYWYGVMLMYGAKYPQAMHEFETYSATAAPENPKFKLATRNMSGCQFAQDTGSVKKEVIVEKLDSVINAGSSNFAAGYYGDPDALLFASARPGNTTPANKKTDPAQAAYTTDLYIAQRINGKWMNPKPADGQFNSPQNDGAATVSFGLANLFFTRWSDDKEECAIYMCKNVNEKWLAPLRLDGQVNMPGTKNMQPYLSNDGTSLFFVSDRPGGQGGFDIWMATIDENGNTQSVVNMGNGINSVEDDITPYYHFTTRTLFYSSKGFGGFGGFDIVKSAMNPEDSTWSVPKNLEAPFNSSRDDAYFSMDRIQQHGYFSSDREKCANCGGEGSNYCYKVYSFTNEPLVFSLHGKVFNSETNEIIPNALLTFKDIRGDNETFYIITDSTGAYNTPLQINWELYIKAQKNKFFGDATNISTVGLTDSKVFEHDFFLTPIPAGEIVIPGIEYDFDRATLRPESKKILDDLADFLTLNDNISVEISSHTDTRGSDSYNLRLSQARAKSCTDYLISKGIASDRLQDKGYGETKPLMADKELYALPTKDEQEAAHQKNRRTAFRPIREGVIQDKWEGKLPNK